MSKVQDNVILLREILHTFGLNSFRTKAFCLKTDLSKAFDRVSWEFISKVLSMHGFPEEFIKWIMACVTSAQYTILINAV